MTEWLVRKFVKNPDDIQNDQTRFSYGILTSLTGIVCNLLLFLIKLAGGILMQSISVLSDSFNNLSDCFSGLITLLGYKAAVKPADREHPFGHGRMEYIAGLAIAAMIFIAAFELLKTSVGRILHPVQVRFDLLLFCFIVVTIPVKLWLSRMNRIIGERIGNVAMKAVAQDARNDVFATIVSLAAMLLSAFYDGFPFDGAAGVILCGLIFRSAVETASDIITKLLGAPTDPEVVRSIREILLEDPQIKGVHDIVIHEYGPGRLTGSAHAEIDGYMSFLQVHEIVDQAEKRVKERLNITLTLHADPYTGFVTPEQKRIRNHLKAVDRHLSIHDYHQYEKDGVTVLDFDVLIPFDSSASQEEIQDLLNRMFSRGYRLEVHFDRGYTEASEWRT